jgi:hypothetical protein
VLNAEVFEQVVGAKFVAPTTPTDLRPAMNADYEAQPVLTKSIAPMTWGPRWALPKVTNDIVCGSE